jgi:Domain of unknown function (DUF7014)/AbiJ N-terminal domain 4/HEPN domain
MSRAEAGPQIAMEDPVAVADLYFRQRKAQLKAGAPDVFQYEIVPDALRAQVVHIWRDALGNATGSDDGAFKRWQMMHDAMAREAGVLELTPHAPNPQRACEKWFLHKASHDHALGMIELTFRWVYKVLSRLGKYERMERHLKVSAEDALYELNQRFIENGVGFQHENGGLVCLDSTYLHAEVVKPALTILGQEPFGAANEDFVTAHKHYRTGDYKDCIVACQRAFESTLKAICAARGWPFAPGDRAPELVTIVRKHGLFPAYLDKGFDTYIALLKTGLPGVRNNAGGHGDEPAALPVPAYIAGYALHLSAANILIVVEAWRRCEAVGAHKV